MEQDVTIRCLLTMLCLVKPLPQHALKDDETAISISVAETICYQYHFYRHLFQRYLEAKYQCPVKAERKFSLLMSILLNDLVVMKENLKKILLEVGIDNLAEIIVETMNLKTMLSEN